MKFIARDLLPDMPTSNFFRGLFASVTRKKSTGLFDLMPKIGKCSVAEEILAPLR